MSLKACSQASVVAQGLCQSAGIPQMILAQWFDLYDVAIRAEYRGIGIFGNKKVAPDFEIIEFGAGIARLINPGKELEGFRARARQVGELCRKAGGKRAAVDKMLEIMCSVGVRT